MNNYMRIIKEELEIQFGDLCADQAELEERLDKQQENVAPMFEQQTCGRKWRPLGSRTRGPFNSCESWKQTCGWPRSRSHYHFSETTEIQQCNILGNIPPKV